MGGERREVEDVSGQESSAVKFQGSSRSRTSTPENSNSAFEFTHSDSIPHSIATLTLKNNKYYKIDECNPKAGGNEIQTFFYLSLPPLLLKRLGTGLARTNMSHTLTNLSQLPLRMGVSPVSSS